VALVASDHALIDTGVIVAALSARDSMHDVCRRALAKVRAPLLTCWPVITEAAWLLRRVPRGVPSLMDLMIEGVIEPAELDPTAPKWIKKFIKQYADQSPQLADAALMYLAETRGVRTILTLDRRDFSVYRTRDRVPLDILPE
jgi:uncharacterized protein